MKVFSAAGAGSPLITGSGEQITELLGKAAQPENPPGHSLARIIIPPGKSSALHYHQLSEETYYILSGTASLEINGESLELSPGQGCLIEPGDRHQIFNRGEGNLEFLAVCVPPWAPEDSYLVK